MTHTERKPVAAFKQARSRATRDRIFLAAREEFSIRGFHGARIERVASAAGVNKQRIYAYFHSKAGLFEAVLTHAYTEMVAEEERIVALLDNPGPHDLITALFDHYMSFHDRHPYFWRLLAWENLSGGQHAQALKGLRTKTLRHLRQRFRTGQTQGIHKDGIAPDTFIFVVMAVVFFYFSNRLTMSQTLNRDLSDPVVRRQILGDIMKLMSA
jgi:AcrR family transcriptional regulator